MDSLSPEDKKRIYEEEAERARAREEINSKAKADAATAHNKNMGIGCLTIIALLVLVGMLMGNCDGNKKPQDLQTRAYVASQLFVKENLKSPSTAKFPYKGYTVVEQEINKYLVKSYVDSQNGFGAMIRSYYICVVSVDEKGNWILESIDIK